MALTSLQTYDIERLLIKGDKIGAIKLYREATGADLAQSKTGVEKIQAALKAEKPYYFKDQKDEIPGIEKPRTRITIAGLGLFFLIDAIVIAGLAYYFIFRDEPRQTPQVSEIRERALMEAQRQTAKTERTQTSKAPPQNPATTSEAARGEAPPQGSAKRVTLPRHINVSDFSALLREGETFDNLYRAKLTDAEYIQRKSSRASTRYDDSLLERKIKSARSKLAAERSTPPGVHLNRIPKVTQQPVLDGTIEERAWAEAARFVVDERFGTTIYLQVDGDWLFIACDAPAERTPGGYDQFRLYLHAGLTRNLVNERIHVGRSDGVTAIRQTEFLWEGKAPKNDDERWKKYKISDWGLYQYAFGSSAMTTGHRQYEAAIHLGEAGLHPGVPFTIYAEIETDPLRTTEGKFAQRQYLGQFGDEHNPVWVVY